MALPTFEIIELTDENTAEMLDKILERYSPREGDRNAKYHYNQVIQEFRSVGGRQFLLSWTGSRMPLGAVLNKHTITWTQRGQVTANPGGDIGAYNRLIERGEESGKEQVMIIYLFKHFSQTDNSDA